MHHEPEREIVVRGTGEARTLPDLAILQIAATADDASAEGAQRRRGEIVAAVDAVLDEHAEAIARILPAAVSVQPRTRWHKGQDVRTGWRASRYTQVEVTGLDAVGRIMAGVAAAGAAVTGPRWSLQPDNPAHEAARVAAAEDARRRGESYARALGLTLGPVAWVAEPGLRSPGPDYAMGVAAPRLQFAAASAAAEEPVEEVTPAELTVDAAVEVAFAIV
ncbi:MAG TPA: SIMPL domain-containing protein [Acidimicrobiales bacterium]|nr:SIMPL domain-containing protein [Acidimicrobiales bacterium]